MPTTYSSMQILPLVYNCYFLKFCFIIFPITAQAQLICYLTFSLTILEVWMSIEIAQSWGRLVVAPKEIVAENLFEDPNEADTIVHPVHLTCVYIHAVGMIK